MTDISYIYDNSRDAGDKQVTGKPQYVRGGYVFTCPDCGKEISSHSYIRLSAWEDAVLRHREKCPGRKKPTVFPNIIYIPFDPDNKPIFEARKHLLEEFLSNGWVLLSGGVVLRDSMGEETHVWILRRDR